MFFPVIGARTLPTTRRPHVDQNNDAVGRVRDLRGERTLDVRVEKPHHCGGQRGMSGSFRPSRWETSVSGPFDRSRARDSTIGLPRTLCLPPRHFGAWLARMRNGRELSTQSSANTTGIWGKAYFRVTISARVRELREETSAGTQVHHWSLNDMINHPQNQTMRAKPTLAASGGNRFVRGPSSSRHNQPDSDPPPQEPGRPRSPASQLREPTREEIKAGS